MTGATQAISLDTVLGGVFTQAADDIAAFRSRGLRPVTDLHLHLRELITSSVNEVWPDLPVIAATRHHGTLCALPDDCVLLNPLDGAAAFLAGSPHFSITACRIQRGFPVQGITDLPAFHVRVSTDRAALTVSGDIEQLPAFDSDTVLISPRHVEQARMLLPDRPIAAVCTASIAMTFVALGRARAAACPPAAVERATPWDYASAALAVHSSGGRAVTPNGSDLAHSRPQAHAGWLASRDAPAKGDLAQLMHPQP
ncbi:hypothetical protein AQJ11_37705 [Streptomyces corchorusii]|uniref:Inositol monophosphatase n=2 Tax=Streptomyces TaxID=1883 RepID=A0A101PTZ2_STRCK|nr:inositol monophosphatase family protein [Streptomyces corchorusii]KUN17602.1 hypothetical protein AQJ11_37705 [Streptomyces corchorusii]